MSTPDEIKIQITSRAPDTLTLRPVGQLPYVLVEVDADAEVDTLAFKVEVGGGVPLDAAEVAELLENTAEFIRAAIDEGGLTAENREGGVA